MDLLCIGNVCNTHGIKGEIKIISDFKYKDVVFKKGNNIYINNTKYIIQSYRYHKIFDMVTLSNILDIDDALKLKGKKVYISRDEYEFDGILNEDIIGLSVYDSDTYKGKVVAFLKTDKYELLVIEGKKRHMVPYISEFVKKIDLSNKRIDIKYIKGLDYED